MSQHDTHQKHHRHHQQREPRSTTSTSLGATTNHHAVAASSGLDQKRQQESGRQTARATSSTTMERWPLSIVIPMERATRRIDSLSTAGFYQAATRIEEQSNMRGNGMPERQGQEVNNRAGFGAYRHHYPYAGCVGTTRSFTSRQVSQAHAVRPAGKQLDDPRQHLPPQASHHHYQNPLTKEEPNNASTSLFQRRYQQQSTTYKHHAHRNCHSATRRRHPTLRRVMTLSH